MKRPLPLLCGLLTGSLLLFSDAVFGQISFEDNFDETETVWPSNEFTQTSELSCEGNSYRVNLYTGFVPNNNAETVSESIGTSNGNEVTLTYDYKLLQTMNGNAAQNGADWGNFSIYYGASASGPFTVLETINTANHIESTDCTTRIVTFTPDNGDEVYLKIVANLGAPTPTNHISFYFDNFTAEQEAAGPCETEAPVAELEQTLCSGSTVADLEAEGDTIIWYSSEDGEEPLNEDTALINEGLYFAAQIPDGECESEERTKVTVFLTVVEEPEVEMTTQTFCGEAEADDLEAEETVEDGELVWYDAETGGNIIGEEDTLEDGEVYYVSQVAGGCESARVGVTVEINVTPEPEAESPQVFEINDPDMPLLVSLYDDVEVTAEGTVIWYATEEDAEDGENALDPETEGWVSDGTYYVTQTIDGCESEPTAVEIQTLLDSAGFAFGSFTYYPNPVKDVLTLSYTEAITHIEVMNMLGQKVLDEAPGKNTVVINLSWLANGSYFIKVNAGEASKTVKVIKQ